MPRENVFWNTALLPSQEALLERIKQIAVLDPQPEIHVRGDRNTAYEHIGRVIVTCQRGGIQRSGFITEPDRALRADRRPAEPEDDTRMGMSIGGGDDEPMMDINMTPLIDVMLVLLIMFIITIPVMTHAVKLDMPRATNAPSLSQPVVINLEIDFDGTVLWNGTPVDIEALEGYFRR